MSNRCLSNKDKAITFLRLRPGRPNRQDAGEREPDGAECTFPQGLAALRQVLVQPARQEDPQEGGARREGQAGKVATQSPCQRLRVKGCHNFPCKLKPLYFGLRK